MKIEFSKREKTGKSVNRKLRVKQLVPAVLYGPDFKQGISGAISNKLIATIANSSHRETTVIDLVMPDGKTTSALIKDVQRHPLTQRLLHLDFVQIVKGQKMKVEIPVIVSNKDISRGIKDGGMLDQPTRTIMIEVMPKDIPSDITIDLRDMALGSEVFVKDLQLPESAELVSDPQQLVLQISQTRTSAAEETAAEGEESGEVEVVARGKAKEGGE